ncbi:MAG: GNAT family N-acetyltransferase [Planctomycetia bacterium]|nr:GNAT family N-acetyltransferase [Planctomycetia bacterium]
MSVCVRLMKRDDWNAVAEVIHSSLNAWYLKNRGFKLVPGPVETMLLFPRIYEALDPDSCVLVEDRDAGRIAGSCFFHVRPTHVSLGILNVHPDYFGRRVAATMLKYVIAKADSLQLPLRLVSSAMNLDSFSLYNRYGFSPYATYQDMTLTVPKGGFPVGVPEGWHLRPATLDDVAGMVALEKELCGIERSKDFRFFIENQHEIWRTSLVVNDVSGKIDGFTASVCDPGSNMIGPGVARHDDLMAALIRHELNAYEGRSPVWLVPTDHFPLRQAMYVLGAKNCEIHFAQSLGPVTPPAGVVLPTFMPESG